MRWLIWIIGTYFLMAYLHCYSAPMITNFNKNEYGGSVQNWSVTIDKRGILYFGNNEGLLEYDGSNWTIYNMPTKTIVRSVFISDDNKIFVGSYEEFGYFVEDGYGRKKYVSLSNGIPFHLLEKNEIWKIHQSESKIYFQSFSRIFIVDTAKHSYAVVNAAHNFVLLQEVRGRFFVHVTGVGLCEVNENQYKLVPGGETFKNDEVKVVLPYGKSDMLVGTNSGKIFLYNNKKFTRWKTDYDPFLTKSQINKGLYKNGRYYLGTIASGVFVIDTAGRAVDHLYSGNGLNNNTILGMCSDARDNLWLALDRGISFVDFNCPMELYIDHTGEIGAVYTAALYDNNLYVGTNQGVILFRYGNDGRFRKVGFIEGTQGQVWQLFVMDHQVLCGHTEGTFRIDDKKVIKISPVKGGFCTKLINSSPATMIQSTYDYLAIFGLTNGYWQFEKTLRGIRGTFPYLEVDHFGAVWVNHIIRGTYRIQLGSDSLYIKSVKSYGKENGFRSEYHAKVAKINNRIVFATGEKIYTWDDLNDTIVPYDRLNKEIGDFAAAEKIVPAFNNAYWFLLKDDAALFKITADKGAQLMYKVTLSRMGISFAPLFINIVPLNDSLHLFCLENGFALYNSRKKILTGSTRLIFRSIQLLSAKNDTIFVSLKDHATKLKIPYQYNTLKVKVALTPPGTPFTFFSYKIEGLHTTWTSREANSVIKIERLQPGEYTLRIMAENNTDLPVSISLPLYVAPPWYRSHWAFVLYGLIVICIVLGIRQLFYYRLKIHKKKVEKEEEEKRIKEKLLDEQKYIKLQNEKLATEIAFKNAQLANTTMSLIKKNEILITLREEIETQKKELGNRYPNKLYDRLTKLIEKDLNNEEYWNLFELHFDQTYQNFLSKLKAEYPELTPSDLRLCAYLRMNLSTKEISSLLNISVRGVEVHRYRLRKKLRLNNEQNLVEFLMNW